MATTRGRLLPVGLIGTWATLAMAPGLISPTNAAVTIKVWKVGSPHRGDTPHSRVPSGLQQAAARNGFQIAVEAFPANGFVSTFVDAVRRDAAPDVLVFDNLGVIEGITTELGRFAGIGREPTIRRDLIQVTGAFDELLGPARGWTYLFSSSPNHKAARTLALRAPECPSGSAGPGVRGELADLASKFARAQLEGNTISIQTQSDSDRLFTTRSTPQVANVGAVRSCGIWGNARLVFAWVSASYEADATLGHTPVLIVLRKQSTQWQLLTIARDPVTNGPFVKEMPSLMGLLTSSAQTHALPAPAMLLSPPAGHEPRPAKGQRFGSFVWRSSPSPGVVAEIVEFAYQDDARLFVIRPWRPGLERRISAGQLWTTGGEWQWRVWSVSGTGDVAFSNAQGFRH